MVRSSLRNKRSATIATVLGIAVANALYIALCIIGVGSVIARSLMLMSVLKLLGGAFLLSVAYHALRVKREDYAFIADFETSGKAQNSFAKEFAPRPFSGLSNPKSIIFYLSLFSVVLTPNVSLALSVTLGVWMSVFELLWG